MRSATSGICSSRPRSEREAATQPMPPADVLLERHLAASAALAEAAQANAAAQLAAAGSLREALDSGDPAAAHAAVDAMWAAFSAFYNRLRTSERAWNDLAPVVAGE